MNNTGKLPAVSGVYVNDKHTFSKSSKTAIRLIKDFGVEGDCHAGPVDQHLFHLRRFGQHPNLRQVHLIHTELFDELALKGHAVHPGDLGENIATKNIELLKLPAGTRLRLGPEAIVELTGLRNPCRQIEAFQPGLLKHVLESTSAGLVRKAGVMSIVIQGGVVQPGDWIGVELPPLPHEPLVYRVPGLANRGETSGHEPAQDQPSGQAHSVV